MSNILVQNIKHTNNTSAQTIDTSGRTTVSIMNNDSTNRSDGGAVTQNLVQGLCKCWCGWNASSGTPTIEDSLNVASLSDTNTGDVQVNFTNSMSNDDYAVPAASAANSITSVDDRATGNVRARSITSFTSYADLGVVMIATHGDLA